MDCATTILIITYSLLGVEEIHVEGLVCQLVDLGLVCAHLVLDTIKLGGEELDLP